MLTVDQARASAKSILARVALGEDPAGARSADRNAATVADIAKRWLTDHIAAKRKPRTLQFYRTGLERHILPAIGRLKAASVSRRDVMKMHGDIARKTIVSEKSAKRGLEERKLGGPVTANRALATVSALFTWAGRAGLIEESQNPARGIERFREEAKERFLTPEEIGRLGEALRLAETTGLPWKPLDEKKVGAKHLPGPHHRFEVFGPYPSAAIRLLILTGMRLREVLHLEWSQYDRYAGVLRLPDSKTGKKTIVLGGAASALIQTIPRLHGARYVISSSSAGLADERPRSDINRPWQAIRRYAGLEDVRLHDLRHSFASVAVSGGAALPQIGKLLGQSQVATIARYAHLSLTAERRVADSTSGEIAVALGLTAVEIPKQLGDLSGE